MTGDFDRARLQVGRLRAFASVTTRAHPAADAVILELLQERGGSATADPVALYRELHLRLRKLAPMTADARPPAGRPAPDAWRDFQQLKDVQRSAIFLVLGLDFSIRDAAAVLGEPETWLTMEVISAMFSLEHILPAQRVPARTAGARRVGTVPPAALPKAPPRLARPFALAVPTAP